MRHFSDVARAMSICGYTVTVLGIAPSVGAQEVKGGLEEVVVTAQRRSERLEDVPMSVTALSLRAIENAGVTNMHDIASVVSGMQVDFAGGYTQPAVRGVTTLTTGTGFENNIAIYVDGLHTADNPT